MNLELRVDTRPISLQNNPSSGAAHETTLLTCTMFCTPTVACSVLARNQPTARHRERLCTQQRPSVPLTSSTLLPIVGVVTMTSFSALHAQRREREEEKGVSVCRQPLFGAPYIDLQLPAAKHRTTPVILHQQRYSNVPDELTIDRRWWFSRRCPGQR